MVPEWINYPEEVQIIEVNWLEETGLPWKLLWKQFRLETETQKCSARTFALVVQVKPSSWIRYLRRFEVERCHRINSRSRSKKAALNFWRQDHGDRRSVQTMLEWQKVRRTSVDAISRLQVGQKSWAFAFQLQGKFTRQKALQLA